MDPTEVVNIHHSDDFDIYIGRYGTSGRYGTGEYHYGNPFTHLPNTWGLVCVENRDEAVESCRRWLQGDPKFVHVEPERREWILENLSSLRGKRLGCFCKPLSCHGDVLIEMMEIVPDGR